jgi:hypothetical protein
MKKIKRKHSRPNKQTVRRRPASNKQIAVIPPRTTFGTFTETGWKPPKHLTYEQWQACGRALCERESAVQWSVGDWWVHGERNYGDRIKTMREGVFGDYSYGTLMVYGSVARAFEPLTRVKGLSFKHHQIVRSLSPAARTKWLDRAVREHLTCMQLSNAISQGRITDTVAEIAAITNTTATGETISTDEPRVVVDTYQDDRPALAVTHNDHMRNNLNTAWALLLDVVKEPRSVFRHHVRGTVEQARAFVSFFDGIALDMSNAVAALDNEANKEDVDSSLTLRRTVAG